MGGIGLRRGRRHPAELQNGDVLDFFRVLKAESPKHLQLLAEMKLPGEATLEFRIHPIKNGRTERQQHSRFLPRGLSGLIYWYILYPFHQWIFKRMLKGIAKAPGKPVARGPDRFAPRLPQVCDIDPRNPL